jgi:DNA-directed RNA polymerase specialized sigma24 family protein
LSPMDIQPSPGKQRSLTQEGFASFLLWLSPDPGQAAREYLDISKTLMKFFVRKGSAHAEELTDRTLDRVVGIVHDKPNKYSTPISLCYGVARKIWLEDLRKAKPEPLEDDNFPAPIQPEDDFTERELQCLKHCLDQLPLRHRELITKYHQFQGRQKIEARKNLAQIYGGLNKLRITACRIRARLHDCIDSCAQRSAMN